jgi:hypothetical protein
MLSIIGGKCKYFDRPQHHHTYAEDLDLFLFFRGNGKEPKAAMPWALSAI